LYFLKYILAPGLSSHFADTCIDKPAWLDVSLAGLRRASFWIDC